MKDRCAKKRGFWLAPAATPPGRKRPQCLRMKKRPAAADAPQYRFFYASDAFLRQTAKQEKTVKNTARKMAPADGNARIARSLFASGTDTMQIFSTRRSGCQCAKGLGSVSN